MKRAAGLMAGGSFLFALCLVQQPSERRGMRHSVEERSSRNQAEGWNDDLDVVDGSPLEAKLRQSRWEVFGGNFRTPILGSRSASSGSQIQL
jgi:hypothetical protein